MQFEEIPLKRKMNEAYLEIYSLANVCLVPIETIVTLFTIKYCNSNVNVTFVRGKKKVEERAYAVDVSTFVYNVLELDSIPYYASSCELPNVIVNKTSCVAGLCASLRQIIKSSVMEVPTHYCRSLLGFKDSCLLACSETSVWTKFCEVDLIATLKSFNDETLVQTELPVSMAKFECHMSHPVRLHNLYKYSTSKKFAVNGVIVQNRNILPEHTYAEGPCLTLADIIIFVCIHILLNLISNDKVLKLLPLTVKWYERVIQNKIILECLKCLQLQENGNLNSTDYTFPIIDNNSLYKSDSKRYKPRNRIYTKQEDIDNSLKLMANLNINTNLNIMPFGTEINFDWTGIPFDATPEGGALPTTRLKRKFEQLENLCKPVIKLAKPGDIIVDFCSGSGHLGILIAYLLPDCSVILLENKEESLNRAKERTKKLKLTNVKFCQCNLDYFKGDFNIGTSLHACGVATDLVIQHCIRKNAVFVSCPCCYGSVHDCHRITYPRSDIFKRQMDSRSYLVLGHAADQTHDAENCKTKQGYTCMAIIDTDRRLQAEQFGYQVHLAKLIPETCTPKNHLLVGIPKAKIINGELKNY